jgi:hypothetical protein
MMLKAILTIDGDAFCNKEWASPVAVEEVAFLFRGEARLIQTEAERKCASDNQISFIED